jgi:hypothetical protein
VKKKKARVLKRELLMESVVQEIEEWPVLTDGVGKWEK